MALAMIYTWEGATKPPDFKCHTKTVTQARQKTQTLHLREPKEIVYKMRKNSLSSLRHLCFFVRYEWHLGASQLLCAAKISGDQITQRGLDQGTMSEKQVCANDKSWESHAPGSWCWMYNHNKTETTYQWNMKLQSNFLNHKVHIRRKIFCLWSVSWRSSPKTDQLPNNTSRWSLLSCSAATLCFMFFPSNSGCKIATSWSR